MPKVRCQLTNNKTIDDIRNAETFSNAIEVLLEMRGYFMPGLAEQLHYSKKYLYDIQQGKVDITLKFARQLEKLTTLPSLFWIELYMKSYEKRED